jgi:hypothetical protein
MHQFHSHQLNKLSTFLGVAQKAFNISSSASYIVFMKNPDQVLDPRYKPLYTKAQKDHFRGRNVEWKKWGKSYNIIYFVLLFITYLNTGILAPLDPSFFDILYSEYTFIGRGVSLIDEDSGEGLVAADIKSQATAEMFSARIRFGKDHIENKVFADLGVNEFSLGPKDSIKNGQFA